MPAGENATGVPEMTESSSRAGRCGGNQTRSPNFYLELLSWQEIPARAPIVLQVAPNYDIDRLLEITRQVEPVIAKVRLMVGQTSPNMPLVAVVRQWLVAGDMTKRVALGAEVFAAAHQIIERKYAGIAARVAAVAHVSTPPDPSVMEHK
jgi:hypothetical protein